MATENNFEGRKIILPGVYSVVKSGIKNPPITLSYGNVLIIDTGSGANYGGGAGINGALAEGMDAVYPIDNIKDFRTLTKGGYWYTLAKPLFEPQPKPGINGASTVYYVRAATTAPAEMDYTPEGGGANGGALVIQCRDEGLIGNSAYDTGGELRKGYAFKMIAGTVDITKYKLEFYRGTYTGAATDGYPYGDIAEADSRVEIVLTTEEFDNFDDLVVILENDATFQEYFNILSEAVAGDGSIDDDDLATYATYTDATGGTEDFGTTDFSRVLEDVATLRYSFLLSDAYGSTAQATNNDLLLSHVIDPDTSFEKIIFIGGGVDSTKFTSESIAAAQHFDSDRVVVVHGGVKIDSSITTNKIREWDALYTTTMVLGRIAGLAPQIPGTYKTVPLSGVQHQLTNAEKKTGLKAGVLMVHYDTQLLNPGYTILQAVNTLQSNLNLVNEDGSTFEISVRRIAAQLNLELTINAREDLFGNENGANLNTLSDQSIVDWTAGQLAARTAKPTLDNLIIEYRNISVDTVQDAKFVTYEFKPNGPVNKFFLTGYMVE